MGRLIQRRLTEVRLVGGRFDGLQGLLEFDVVKELLTYKDILTEIAKETWRHNNPDRKNLPHDFEKDIRLAFGSIRPGSVAVPVERLFEVEVNTLPYEPPKDEIDEAARTIEQTLRAAERDERFPDGLTKSVIPMFGQWGGTLQEGEAIELYGNGASERARFDGVIRERIISCGASGYRDRIAVTGEIRRAELLSKEGGNFAIHLDNGSVVHGAFSSQQESLITDGLHRHKDVRLRIEGLMEFGPDGRMKKVLEIGNMRLVPSIGEEYDHTARPIWEVAVELGRSILDEEWDKMPTDAAQNLDHYLYGMPKEEP